MGRERGVQRDDAKVIAGLTGIAFTVLLIIAVVAIALGATKYSLGLSLACLALPLLGFILAWLVYFRARTMSKKYLQLELEREKLRPGEMLSGSLVLRLDRSSRMRSLQVRVWGGETVEILESYGNYTMKFKEERPWIDKDLELIPEGLSSSSAIHRPDRTRVPAGKYRFRFEEVIPMNAVPCWRGNSVEVSAFVRARAYFAMGADATQERDLRILHPLVEDVRTPFSFSAEKEKLLSGIFGIQAHLDAVSARQGGAITGRVSITVDDPNRVKGIQVQLVEWERAIAQGHSSMIPKVKSSCSIPMAGGPAVAIPFRLPVPQDVRPSVHGLISRLSHSVRIRLEVKLGRDVTAEGEVVILPGMV